MASELKSPTISASTTWSNPDGAEANGGGQASYLIVTTGTQNAYKTHRGFNFNISSDQTILGIEVKSDLYDTPGCTRDSFRVRLSKDNGSNYTSSKSITNAISGTETTKTFGNSTDLWGTTWTPSEINSSNFLVENGITSANSCVADTTFYDDWTRITVYYTTSTPQNNVDPNTIYYGIWHTPGQINAFSILLCLITFFGFVLYFKKERR